MATGPDGAEGSGCSRRGVGQEERASRNFVNVPLNIWLNEKNVSRMHSLIGNQYSAKLNTANTVFCIFENGIAGRMHIARLTDKEFAVAKAEGLVHGGTQSMGLFFMYPEAFGRNAEVTVTGGQSRAIPHVVFGQS